MDSSLANYWRLNKKQYTKEAKKFKLIIDSMQANFDTLGSEMQEFIKDYLKDISTLLFQIKSNVYDLIQIKMPTVLSKPSEVTSDIPSILSHCKKTFDDIKRIDSLLAGYVKGSAKQRTTKTQTQGSSQSNRLEQRLMGHQEKRNLQSKSVHPNFSFGLQLDNDSSKFSQSEEGKFSEYKNEPKPQPEILSRYNYSDLPIENEDFGQGKPLKERTLSFNVSKRKNKMNTNENDSLQINRALNVQTQKSGRNGSLKVEDDDESWRRVNTMYENRTDRNDDFHEYLSVIKGSKAFEKKNAFMSDIVSRNADCLYLIGCIKKEIAKHPKKGVSITRNAGLSSV